MWVFVLDLCWECREGFLFQQQRDLREYTQATIYIRKVVEDQMVGQPNPHSCIYSCNH